MRVLLLFIALQVAGQDIDKRIVEMRRLEELRQNTSMEEAKARDARYREYILRLRHYEFVTAFNAYLQKYNQRLSATKELSKAMKAMDTLKKTEGFDYAKH